MNFKILIILLLAGTLAHSAPQADTIPPTSPRSAHKPAKPHTPAILYRNTKYGFTFALPRNWKGYSIDLSTWEGGPREPDTTVERGTILIISPPPGTTEEPPQGIPIMVFSRAQWRGLQNSKFSVSAAPFDPEELGHNQRYVFAIGPRTLNPDVPGYEEAVEILKKHPLHAF